MLPLQILLKNLLYDLSEIGIPFDDVDKEDLAQPHTWYMAAILRFTLVRGAVSSLFDAATFVVLVKVFSTDAALFQTSWLLESIVILVIFLIRSPTAGTRQLAACRPDCDLARRHCCRHRDCHGTVEASLWLCRDPCRSRRRARGNHSRLPGCHRNRKARRACELAPVAAHSTVPAAGVLWIRSGRIHRLTVHFPTGLVEHNNAQILIDRLRSIAHCRCNLLAMLDCCACTFKIFPGPIPNGDAILGIEIVCRHRSPQLCTSDAPSIVRNCSRKSPVPVAQVTSNALPGTGVMQRATTWYSI